MNSESLTIPLVTNREIEGCLPPSAPLDMPRQVLEDERRPSLVMMMSRLLLRNA